MKGEVGRRFVAYDDFTCPAMKKQSTILDFSSIPAYL